MSLRAISCPDCRSLDGLSEPWYLLESVESSEGGWAGWVRSWTVVADVPASGPAHSLWVDSDSSEVSILLAIGYGRSQSRSAVETGLNQEEEQLPGKSWNAPLDRPPTLAAVTEPVSGEVIRPIIVHDETWVLPGSGSDLDDTMQLMAWCVVTLIQPEPDEEILVQVVQRERSCERCWKLRPTTTPPDPTANRRPCPIKLGRSSPACSMRWILGLRPTGWTDECTER